MKKIEFYQIDAFTDQLFGGNPACVVLLDEWLSDGLLLKIAMENAVPETAFFVADGEAFHLRWFTPDHEMDLCGHATLATAHVLKTILNYQGDKIIFNSKSGLLEVTVADEQYTLNFPSRNPEPAELPEIISRSLKKQPKEVLKSRDYVLVYDDEQDIRDLVPDREVLNQINLDPGGIIITAKGDKVDFVSRFFVPQASIFEDPVTGSAHCSLIPYWAEKLGKTEMSALQLSDRLGKLQCVSLGDRVLISGTARTYAAGFFFID
ncbi:isomerase [Pedobacter ginsengisoli]|uniref:Isomerase n=1 Tax=Pedobacter ginsengisoli TaxID=363852 RepID=A0A2D1U5V5_9SPHI|nr:PhzF family phenazine biosynthesis protein [Pedobacter ginsengisoli]ATP56968.1 isomerase [Pedobacter ginsengisoli]